MSDHSGRTMRSDGVWFTTDGTKFWHEDSGSWRDAALAPLQMSDPPPLPEPSTSPQGAFRVAPAREAGHETADAVANSMGRFMDVFQGRQRIIWSWILVSIVSLGVGGWINDVRGVSLYGTGRDIIFGSDPDPVEVPEPEEAPAPATTEPATDG